MIAIMRGVEIVKSGFKSSADAVAALRRGELKDEGELFIGSEPVYMADVGIKTEEKVVVNIKECRKTAEQVV